VAVVLDFDGHAVRDARVVISAATDVPTRLDAAETVLSGKTVDGKLLREVGDAAVSTVELIGDEHGSAAYKRELIRVQVPRAVQAALNEKPGDGG
jgi:carbon-monoxide dehydrogenase medium subunit